MRPAKPSSILLLLPALTLLIAAQPATAQRSPIRMAQALSETQRALPAEGPASFWFNPAALAETHWGSLAYGYPGSVSGKSGFGAFSATGALPIESVPWSPIGIAVGYAARGGSQGADGGKSISLVGESRLSLALSLPPGPDRRYRVSLGLARTSATYDGDEVLDSPSTGIDLGAYSAFTAGAGRFRFGTTLHHFLSPRIAVQPFSPGIKASMHTRRWFEQDLGWTRADGCLRVDLGLFYNQAKDPAEGPDTEDPFGINGWELEARPTKLLGFGLERPRSGAQTALSLILHPSLPVDGAEAFMAIGIGHDNYDPESWLPLGKFTRAVFGQADDDGRGFLITLTARAEI